MNEASSIPAREPMVMDWLAMGAALVTVVLWGSAFVGIRAVADDLSPGALAVGRLLVGSLALGVVVALRRPAWPSRPDLAWIAACGVVWFGAYNVSLNALVPPVAILLAWLVLSEVPPVLALVGGELCIGGVIVARSRGRLVSRSGR